MVVFVAWLVFIFFFLPTALALVCEVLGHFLLRETPTKKAAPEAKPEPTRKVSPAEVRRQAFRVEQKRFGAELRERRAAQTDRS